MVNKRNKSKKKSSIDNKNIPEELRNDFYNEEYISEEEDKKHQNIKSKNKNTLIIVFGFIAIIVVVIIIILLIIYLNFNKENKDDDDKDDDNDDDNNTKCKKLVCPEKYILEKDSIGSNFHCVKSDKI